MDHLFFYFLVALTLWSKLFGFARIDWVPPRSVVEMITIASQGFGGLPKGKSLWGIVILIVI